jgi:Arc/MetJ family transcription regulator
MVYRQAVKAAVKEAVKAAVKEAVKAAVKEAVKAAVKEANYLRVEIHTVPAASLKWV